MGKHQAISAEIDDDTLADLKRLAEHMDCSVEHLATTAVLRFVNDEISTITPDEFAHLPAPPRDPSLDWEAIDKARASFRAWLKEGEDAIAKGDFISHEDFMAELRLRYGKKRAA